MKPSKNPTGGLRQRARPATRRAPFPIGSAHDRLSRSLAPVSVHLDVLRLHTHSAGSDEAAPPELEEAAALYDVVRTHLDAVEELLERARPTSSGHKAA